MTPPAGPTHLLEARRKAWLEIKHLKKPTDSKKIQQSAVELRRCHPHMTPEKCWGMARGYHDITISPRFP